jgi:hypothetical protein
MKTFQGEDGREWIATTAEEDVPRHHGRWYMVLRATDGEAVELALPEVRWQTRHTADRSIRAMSEFELKRRLRMATRRQEPPTGLRDSFGAYQDAGPGAKGGTGAA